MPFHYVPDGRTIDELPLDLFAAPALVAEIDTTDRYVTAEHVAALELGDVTRVLFKTRNSQLLKQAEYDPDFVALSTEAATLLVERGATLVGLDYLSIAHADEQVPVHRALLDHGIVVLEGVDLADIDP